MTDKVTDPAGIPAGENFGEIEPNCGCDKRNMVLNNLLAQALYDAHAAELKIENKAKAGGLLNELRVLSGFYPEEDGNIIREYLAKCLHDAHKYALDRPRR